MILVDTSVWVDHFRHANPGLAGLLHEGQVACHPFVVGELALGRLKNRADILELLTQLPAAPVVDHREALALVERRRLAGAGVGWVDVHLLASALVDRLAFWTLDRRLAAAARDIGIAHA